MVKLDGECFCSSYHFMFGRGHICAAAGSPANASANHFPETMPAAHSHHSAVEMDLQSV